MFGEFLPQVVKSFFIQPDVVDHVVQVGKYNFDDLLDVVSTLTAVLYLEFNLLVVAFTDLLQHVDQLVPVIEHGGQLELEEHFIFLLTWNKQQTY